MNTDNSSNKAGRPYGSVTCRRVKFKDLQKHIAEEGTVLASQAWLQACGIPYDQEEEN